MEKTFASIVKMEGAKDGYTEAINAIYQFTEHDMLEDGVKVDMPNIENILSEVV